ncbi:MAG: hypothetical protein AB7N80_00205 [Bdellovibrionales bacterium]
MIQKSTIFRVLASVVALSVIVFAFQNCGGFTAISNSGLSSFAFENQYESVDWAPFQQATQDLGLNFQNNMQLYYWNNSEALLSLRTGLYRYNPISKTAATLILSANYRSIGIPMMFPQFGRVAVQTLALDETFPRLTIVNAANGAVVFRSEQIIPGTCRYNPAETEFGKVLCVTIHPTDANNGQFAIVNIRDLNIKKMALSVAGHNVVTAATGTVLFDQGSSTYVLNREDKVLTDFFDTTTTTRRYFLFSETVAQEIDSVFVYDYAGNGTPQAYSDFRVTAPRGYFNVPAICDNMSYQSLQFSLFRSGPNQRSGALCETGEAWILGVQNNLLKCTSPTACTDYDLSTNSLPMLVNANAGSYYTGVIYLSASRHLLVPVSLDFYGDALLTQINMETEVKEVINLGPTTPDEQAVILDNFAFVLNLDQARRDASGAVLGYQLYLSDRDQLFNLPIIANSGNYKVTWLSHRRIGTTDYLIGNQTVGGVTSTLIYSTATGLITRLAATCVGNDKQNGSLIFLETPGLLEEYDLVTNQRRTLATLAANQRTVSVLADGDIRIISSFGANQNQILVYRAGTLAITHTEPGLTTAIQLLKDKSAVILHVNTGGLGSVRKLSFATNTVTASQGCNNTYCQPELVDTVVGEVIIDRASGRIMNTTNLDVLADMEANLATSGARADHSRTSAYFLNFTPGVNNSYTYTLRRYDYATRAATTVIDNQANIGLLVLNDSYLITRKVNGTTNAEIHFANGQVLNFNDINNASRGQGHYIINQDRGGKPNLVVNAKTGVVTEFPLTRSLVYTVNPFVAVAQTSSPYPTKYYFKRLPQ